MRIFIFILFLSSSFNNLWAQNIIDFQQKRIDFLDEVQDGQIANNSFNYLYFEQIDHIQELLLDERLDPILRKKFEMAVYYELYIVNAETLKNQQKGPASFMYFEEFLKRKLEEKAYLFLEANPTKAYELIALICESPELKVFLENECQNNPGNIMLHFKKIAMCTYAPDLLSLAVQNDPIAAKQYLSSINPVFLQLSESKHPADQLILKIYKETNSASLALSLLPIIMDKTLSIKEADALANVNNHEFLLQLFALTSKKNTLAKNSIDKLLTDICTKKTRVINAAYEIHESPQRFLSLSSYKSSELYNVIVYSQEEIFTSSFNGIYKMLLSKLKSEEIGAYQLLKNVNFNQFRTFIKMCSSYGKLEDFLGLMSDEERASIISKFVALDKEPNLLKEAVSIADAIGSIKDAQSIKLFEQHLLNNYQKSKDANLKLMYVLLIKLFADKAIDENAQFREIANSISMNSLIQMGNASLYGMDGIHTQLHLFYDDEDGKVSYATFMNGWDAKIWEITRYPTFIRIKNKQNNEVQIFANKPSYVDEGVEAIHHYLSKEDSEIEVLVHRGHSFYVPKSLFNLTTDVNIVMLGSCGGYNQVLEVLNKAPNAHIISTKQVGTYQVNNPMLHQLANMVNKGEEICWDKFWLKLSTQFPENSDAQEKFIEYIPPHQNLGAAFIQAYRQHLSY